jgi:hypothetical protein
MLGNSHYKLYNDRSVVTNMVSMTIDWTEIYLTKPSKKHSIDVAIPNIHNLHSTITKKLHKYTDLKEYCIRIWQLQTVHIIPPVLSRAGIIGCKLYGSLKLLDLCPGIYILLQNAVILSTCHIWGMFVAEQLVQSAWSVWPVLLWEKVKLLWSKEGGSGGGDTFHFF